MTEHHIKRGVSLYSYQDEAWRREYSLEELIAASARIDARGIEILPEQSFDNFPDITDQQVEQWFAWHEKYGTHPVAYDMFLDTKRYPGRVLTVEECVESLRRDIELAARLDTRVIRVIINTPPEVVEAAAPIALEHGIRLGLEIHAPVTLNDKWVQRHLDVIHRVDNGHLGLVPDFSTFVKRVPRVVTERALRNGATPHIVEYIAENYAEQRPDPQTIPVEVAWMGGNPVDMALAHQAIHYCYWDPRELLPHMDYLFHIQAKFFEMVDDHQEYSIDYGEVIDVLIEGGYRGYLSSEYEGNRHIEDLGPVDSIEQVRRQHAMMAELLGERATTGVGSDVR
jgi:sugar phosphate isomerase/epimerase